MKESFMDARIDRIDRKMIKLLQADGRISNAELAQKVSVSPATCHRRTQRLFDEGIINSVTANINPEAVGRGGLVIVGAILERSTPDVLPNSRRPSLGSRLCLNATAWRGTLTIFSRCAHGTYPTSTVFTVSDF